MNLRYKAAEFIGTVAYVGRLPIAPGTWGSLAALTAWFFLKPSISDPLFLLINKRSVLFDHYHCYLNCIYTVDINKSKNNMIKA